MSGHALTSCTVFTEAPAARLLQGHDTTGLCSLLVDRTPERLVCRKLRSIRAAKPVAVASFLVAAAASSVRQAPSSERLTASELFSPLLSSFCTGGLRFSNSISGRSVSHHGCSRHSHVELFVIRCQLLVPDDGV